MDKIAERLAAMCLAPRNVRFADPAKVCDQYFGVPRQRAPAIASIATPGPGDPHANIQRGKAGQAKACQVRQVLATTDKLEASS